MLTFLKAVPNCTGRYCKSRFGQVFIIFTCFSVITFTYPLLVLFVYLFIFISNLFDVFHLSSWLVLSISVTAGMAQLLSVMLWLAAALLILIYNQCLLIKFSILNQGLLFNAQFCKHWSDLWYSYLSYYSMSHSCKRWTTPAGFWVLVRLHVKVMAFFSYLNYIILTPCSLCDLIMYCFALLGFDQFRFGHVFSFDTGTSVGEIMGQSKPINSVDFRADRPMRIVTASEDNTVAFFHGPPFKFQFTIQVGLHYVCYLITDPVMAQMFNL